MNFYCTDKITLLRMYSPEEIAKYIRLSMADEYNQSDESESVVNQRRLMNEFINRNGNVGDRCKEFIDDGVSGTNFDRPGWNNLMAEMESGKIKVVITKSLSRLGRSSFECGYYIDYYFPKHNIRYIAIQEQIDTQNKENSNNEYVSLNNFINEKYSRDLSKNIKRVYKIKQYAGEYMGGIPIYGYKKDPKDKHKLIIDEESADVVRKIFEYYLKTQSKSMVAKLLTKEKIPIPEVYKKTRRGLNAKYPYEWSMSTVSKILNNQMYIGNMVQNVYNKQSFREKKIIKTDPKEWIIVENTHEPIIDIDTFNRVQNIIKANYRLPTKPYQRLFDGLLYCAECGHKIGIGNPKKDGRPINQQYVYTYCNLYRKNSAYNKCSPHSNNYNKLEQQLLNIIGNICDKYMKLIDVENILSNKKTAFATYTNTLKKKIGKLETDIKQLDVKIEKIYEDRLNDVITTDTYKKLTSKLEEEKSKKSIEIDDIKVSLQEYQQNNGVEQFLDANKLIEQYYESRKNPPRELILKIVDRIEIHSDKTIDVYLKIKQLKQFF